VTFFVRLFVSILHTVVEFLNEYYFVMYRATGLKKIWVKVELTKKPVHRLTKICFTTSLFGFLSKV
jgi:hypothetical protein